MKGRVVRKRRVVRRIRPTLNQQSCDIGVPDGFTQKERELKRKYPGFSDFITSRIIQAREKHSRGLPPDLGRIEDEIRNPRQRRKYNSGKARSKS